MKIFICSVCGKRIGEMIKGKIKKGTVMTCKDCDAKKPPQMPQMLDMFKNLFG